MTQLDLPLDGPEPIRKWLHVWSEAERAARIKNQQRDRLGNAAGESPANRTEETCRQEGIKPLPSPCVQDGQASPSDSDQAQTADFRVCRPECR